LTATRAREDAVVVAAKKKALVRQPPPKRAPPPVTKKGNGAVRKRNLDFVRQKAGLVYTTDPDGLTVLQLRELEEFKDVPVQTLQKWSQLDNWTSRRKEVFEKWRIAAEDRLGGELARTRIEELRELQDIKRLALGKLKSAATEAKSWEGVAKVLVLINERIEYLAKTASDTYGGGPAAPTEGGGEVKIGLTDVELDAAIDAILKARVEGSGTGQS
jgi:hypothetical protein